VIGDLVSGSEGKNVLPPAPEADSSARSISAVLKKRWLLFCLVVSLFYACLGLIQAFNGEFVVQDDARHHVIWMQSFRDPELFRGDLIAQYFQSIAGPTFSSIYWLAAKVGVDIIFVSKILPVVLSLIAGAFCYLLSLRLIPSPAAAALCTVIFLQGLWMEDDVQSACARAFYYPLFLPFLYYLGKRKLIPVVITLALQGAYPSLLILSEAILVSTLVTTQGGRIKVSSSLADYKLVAAGIIAGGIGMLPVLLSSQVCGATVSGAEAVKMPEFHPGGREEYYSPNPLTFWVTGLRSGVFPMDHPPPIISWVGLLFPFMLLRPSWFPLSRSVSREMLFLFARIIVLGVTLYLIATALAFQLYIPNRYSAYGLRMILCLAAGLAISLVADRIFKARPKFAFLTPLALCLIALSPLLQRDFPRCGYVIGCNGDLYRYLETQPKNTLVASLDPEAANLPAFAKRSVLATKEYGIAFKKGYYKQFSQRMKDTIAAQYSPNISDVQKFNKKYNVTHWLLARNSFSPDYLGRQSRWLVLCFQPEEQNARKHLESGGAIALEEAVKDCTVFKTNDLILLSAEKINQIDLRQ
jgi:hypothetical protein